MPASLAIARVIARGIVKSFGSTMALRGVDATLETARLTLIEGSNGSGKSTLLGILGTVIRPTAGTVVYEPLGDDRSEIRAANLSGDCFFSKELMRGNVAVAKQQQACVKRRALLSVKGARFASTQVQSAA